MALNIRKDILWRVYLIYILILVLAIFIIARVVKIQVVEGDFWKTRANALTIRYANIEAIRGNIFDVNGQLLATSLPQYDVAVDMNSEAITDEIFNENVDSLALSLTNLFGDKTKDAYKRELTHARVSGYRYYLLSTNISYKELHALKTFPLFRKGRFKGGLIYIQKGKRELPFKFLAARTIGYANGNSKPVGLEGSFDEMLKGIGGKRLVRKIAGGVEMPINNENEIDPQDGCDIVSTIDINIQDVAESALYEQLKKHRAAWGTVVLMEVATGEVRAIANLSKVDSVKYAEQYNYAIGQSTEPGSTFKLISLMAAMEDGYIDLEDTVNTGNGRWRVFKQEVKDSHEGGFGKLSVQQVFEKSSNVGTAKLISKYYAKNPQKFIDRIFKMGINLNPSLDIAGTGKPQIKTTKSKEWSGVSLPWMSYGYELTLTPLQILTFYNAVANDGVMMKPIFVREIRKQGRAVEIFAPQNIHSHVASLSTIKKAKKLMEGVVLRGTATNLKNPDYTIAGKTGTAQISKGKGGYGQHSRTVTYQASFVGYFPADNPKYSCIVMVNAPSEGVYYGNAVAGPIFKEIADKVYSTLLDIHDEVHNLQAASTKNPPIKSGLKRDIDTIYKALDIGHKSLQSGGYSQYISVYPKNDSVQNIIENKVELALSKNKMPNVIGMGLKDAIYLLENAGIKVRVMGNGAVKKQSIPVGEKIYNGIELTLELS